MALDMAKKKEIIAKFARDSKDTGSGEVQAYPKAHSSRLGLLKLVGQRKSLLSYLKKTQYNRYAKLIGELKLKDR